MAAKTKAEVDAQSAADRAWDSLNYSYDQKAKKINQNYDKAYSQASNQQLARGMQRSSYANQVLAGVNQQRNQALSDNEDALIADYQKWRYQIDRDAVADEQWQKQFDETARQFNATHELNRDIASNNHNVQLEQLRQSADRIGLDREIAAQNYNLALANYNETVRSNTAANELAWRQLGQGQQQIDLQQQQINNQASQWATEHRDKLTQQDWENRFAWEQADLAQKNNVRDYLANRADRASDEAYRASEAQRNQSNIDREFWHQVEREGVQDAQWSDETAYQRTRDAIGDARYEEERDYTRNRADQETAANMALTLLNNGQMPSAEMLEAAGMSQEYADALIAIYNQQNGNSGSGSGTGGNGGGNGGGGGDDDNGNDKPTDNDVFNWLTATPQERKDQLDKTGKSGMEYLKAGYDATKTAFNDWAKEFFTGKKNNKK